MDSSEDSVLDDLPLWGDDRARAKLEKVCAELSVPVDVISELVALQRDRLRQERASGVYLRIEEILGRFD